MVSVAGFGQSLNEGSRLVDAKLDYQGHELKGAYVVINYEIPYSGVVEIRLFDQDGEKIWQNQYAHSYGTNQIVLKAGKFHPGETYAYRLNYKRDEITSDLVIPPSNFME